LFNDKEPFMGNAPRNIVIIGGTGLIGQQLAKQLISGGYYPIVLTRNLPKAKKLFGDGVQVAYWSGIDVPSLTEIISGSAAVVNLAGESIAARWTKSNKDRILKSRVNTTNTLVHAIKGCSQAPVVFIQASATGYYPHNFSNPMDEDRTVGNGFLSQVVVQWEKAAEKVEDKSRLIIVRTGIVLSPDGGFLAQVLPTLKTFIGGWFGNGSQMLSWIHIEDHVRAIQFLIDSSSAKGIYNLVSPEPVTYKHFVKRIGKTINRPVWMPIPAFVVRMIFGKMADEVVLSNQTVIPKRLLLSGFQFKYCRVEDALNDLLRKELAD
jgi:uncharacterized protein (TIGR01777 family)